MSKQRTALCIGATGQDGSLLCDLLLEKGYKVIGTKRRTSLINTSRIDHIFNHPNFKLEYYDLNDVGAMYSMIMRHQPDEIYNLAAQSHVRVSFDIPEHTVDGVAMGPLRILEAIRNIKPDTKFYQASSSEMFGDAPMPNSGYSEGSLMAPASPYACAKLFAHKLTRNYRESYGLHASAGILFNHESERRSETFVTRKITIAAAKIKLGLQNKLYLGNLDAKRDWGHAKEYVEAMYLMLQQDKPDDYVIATGETRSVKEFLEIVFDYANLDPYKYVETDERLFRPQEVPILLGDTSKAKKVLNWQPKTSLNDLAKIMYDSDYKIIENTLTRK